MFDSDQYQLLDFGGGRKLERFGELVLDRPSPAASSAKRQNEPLGRTAHARFIAAGDTTTGCGQRGTWVPAEALPAAWTIKHARLVFELRPTEFGHVGIFPEQAENWEWIAQQVERLHQLSAGVAPRVLNLFAYTGASTLAAAAAGAEVVHVDAAKSTVAWARRNADLSGLADASIRWIVEDAARFVAREQRRGNRYGGIILDPPTYGHGPKGEPWQLADDLPGLLTECASLLEPQHAFLLVTCHAPGVGPAELSALVRAAAPAVEAQFKQTDAGDLSLKTDDGRALHSGVMARWAGGG